MLYFLTVHRAELELGLLKINIINDQYASILASLQVVYVDV